MTFEFYGADLETPEGVEIFKTVYVAVAKTNSDSAIPFEDADYGSWAEESPEEANAFLKDLASDESPHIRNFAGRIARTDWLRSNPELAVEVMTGVMMDDDPIARGTIPEFIEEAMGEETFENWLTQLGLPRIHQLLVTAKRAQEMQS